MGSDITDDERREFTITHWRIPPANMTKKRYDHPCPFPNELARRLIRLWSYPSDVVLDCFNGCGTTTAVAAMTNRQWVGIDVVPRHCENARKRTKNAYNKREKLSG